MDYWMELRTALMVARLGTVSAAAEALGVHPATVNRHVETLEGAFGPPLFQRHARGYAPTDAGRDMLEAAGRADEMLADLAGRARGRAALGIAHRDGPDGPGAAGDARGARSISPIRRSRRTSWRARNSPG